MSPPPLVTVIIPSYNHAQWIGNAIESVLHQTYRNIELIVVDDASTDNTALELERYQRHPGVRIVLKNANKGQSHSINVGLELASGKYVSFLPSDDWYLPQKTAVQVARFESAPPSVGLVYGRGQRYFMDTDELVDVVLPMHRGDVLRRLVQEGNFIYPATPMFRAEAFQRISLDETYKAEGESIYIKLAEHYEFEYVDETLAVMRAHTYNTGRAFEAMYHDNVRWWTEYFSREEVPARVADLRNEVLGKIHRMYGLSILTELNKTRLGRQALLRAVQVRWRYALDPKVVAAIALSLLPESVNAPIFASKRKGGRLA